MSKNLHPVDRLLRVIVAEGMIFSGFFWVVSPWNVLLYAGAAFLLLNALTGFCYFYALAGVGTVHKSTEGAAKVIEIILIYTAILFPLLLFYRTGDILLPVSPGRELILGLLVGFVAEIIDGSLGMAYGISSNTFLLSMGIPPVAASASVHTAEIVTSAFAGIEHWRANNVDRHVLKYLSFSGMIGAFIGAYLLTNISTAIIKPLVALYLFVMGVLLLEKAYERKPTVIRVFLSLKNKLNMLSNEPWGRKLMPFGVAGGFLDAIGGGGWGPLITLTLFFKGEDLRKAIGSVNVSEFFVTLIASLTFFTVLRGEYWQTIAGLMAGGLLAAPLGPYLTQKLPYKPLMLLVGTVVTLLSLRTLYLFFFTSI